MASNALSGVLLLLLADADYLSEASAQLPLSIPDRAWREAAMNRAVVVACVSAWEAYIEELVRECLNLLRPAAPPLGLWPALNATVRGQLGRFNNPNTENIRMLISDAFGLQDIQTFWVWQNFTTAEAVRSLGKAMTTRHQIAHGVNPRPLVDPTYANQLPELFRNLANCTDRAVRDHLVNVLGIANPWPL